MNIPQGQLLKYGRNIAYQAQVDQGEKGDQTDWKAKFEGLQAQIAAGNYVTKDSYVALQRNLEAAVNERKAAQGDLGNAQAKIALLTDAETTLKNQIMTIESDKTKLASDLAQKGAVLERHNVIFKNYPHLSTFEADGLLPVPGEGQNLEDVLKAFSDKVLSLKGQSVEDYKKGDIGNPPEKKDATLEKTPTALLAKAKALSVGGDQKAYDAAMDEYQAAKALEATKPPSS